MFYTLRSLLALLLGQVQKKLIRHKILSVTGGSCPRQYPAPCFSSTSSLSFFRPLDSLEVNSLCYPYILGLLEAEYSPRVDLDGYTQISTLCAAQFFPAYQGYLRFSIWPAQFRAGAVRHFWRLLLHPLPEKCRENRQLTLPPR